jgi:hypothetical protein
VNLYRYSVVDADGHEGEAVFESYQEAEQHARSTGGQQVIEYEFEFSDSSLVWSAPGAPGDRRIAS